MLEIVRFLTPSTLRYTCCFANHEDAVNFDFNTPLAGVTLLQVSTIAIALVGAVLGVVNTWASVDKSRIKLRVRPAHAIPSGGAPQHIGMSITVTNLSAFAVTVDEVGLFYRGTVNRGAIITPILADDGKWPRRLEPRSSVTIYAQRPQPHTHSIKCAYARTECGVTQRGSSPALRQMSREA
jgi:hypothetical protein